MRTAATVALRAVPRAALALPPAWRRRLATGLLTLVALTTLYYGWFRNSSLVRVENVEVTGVSGSQGRAIRTALVDAGMSMTTLHVRDAALRAAVSNFPVVHSVTASGDFPHLLRIEVELNLPVAVLQTEAGRVPVAADGLLLRDVPATGGLPTLSAGGSLPAERVDAGRAFALLRVAALAPAPLRTRIRAIGFRGPRGIVAQLRRGPDLIFGDTDRLAAKWLAAARVLASPAARGATYIDLRLPDRPVAGGLSTTGLLPLAPAGPAAGTTPTTPTTTTGTTQTTTATATTTSTGTTSTPATTTTTAATTPATTTTTTTPATTAPATSGGATQAPG